MAYVDLDREVSIAHHQCGHDGGPPNSEPLPCEPGDVSGTVTDADTGYGLGGATVTIEETERSGTTDSSGGYLIADVEAGDYTVTAAAEGYTSESKTVTVDGDTGDVDFVLTADSGDGGDGGGTEDGAQVTPWGVSRTGADDAQSADHTGDGVHVYVIDSGIDADHVDLVDNLGAGHAAVEIGGETCEADWDDDYGHGTHVAGTAGAADNPEAGGQVVGVAPEVTLHAVKVLDRRGRGWSSDVIAGIDWVARHNANEAPVANMSLGRSGSKTGTCTDTGLDGTDSYHEAICTATNTGVVFAVAAGNSGADTEGTVPAAYDDTVITASATQCDLGGDHNQTCVAGTDDWPTWSNWGDESASWTGNDSAPVAIAAPGVDVLSAWDDGGTHVGSGTSMAASHVAGVAAVLLAESTQAADATAFDHVRTWLLDHDEDTSGFDNTSGSPHAEDFLDLRDLASGG